MRVAVLSSQDSWYFRDLQRASVGRCELVVVPHTRLASFIQDEHISWQADEHELSSFDAVLVRTMPPGSLEQVVFRMDVLGQLESQGTLVFNSPRALETAVDKYLSSTKLRAAGLKQPFTRVSQTAEQALDDFEQLGRDVVVKPLFGSEGRGLTRISDPDLALRAFRMLEQLGAVIYLQQFVPHAGFDLRLFVLGDHVWGMRRINLLDWRTNVSRGATTEPLDVSDELCAMARKAAIAVGTTIAGVDVLPGQDGQYYVLEVNAVPGWKALARTLQVDVAGAVLDYTLDRIRERREIRHG